MKVLMFGWEFPPHKSGGLGTACYGLTKGLAGFPDLEVTFVVPKAWGDEDQAHITLLGANEIPVIHQQIQFADATSKMEYYELHSSLVPYLGTSEFFELKAEKTSGNTALVEITEEGKIMFTGDYGQNLFQEIDRYAIVAETIARELEFDVIHVHDWMTFPAGIAAKRISGKPLVVHIHSTEFDRSGPNVNSAIYDIEKKGMDAADQVIVVSHFTRDIVIRNYYIHPEKIKTIYNSAGPVLPEFKTNFRKITDEKTVTFLGRITGQKGPVYFVEAANLVLQKMKNVRFVMAGKGDLLNAMIGRAAELNISDHFHFPGFLKDSEVPELFLVSDVFVMPSVSEPFGIVALEAMQAAVPVIISRQSGVSEILKNAILVDYWDIHSIADSISNLLNDPVPANKFGRNGRIEANKLLWKNSAAEVREIYLNLPEAIDLKDIKH
jgi:glycosyltransferase involved in cell wall biosynthesis